MVVMDSHEMEEYIGGLDREGPDTIKVIGRPPILDHMPQYDGVGHMYCIFYEQLPERVDENIVSSEIIIPESGYWGMRVNPRPYTSMDQNAQDIENLVLKILQFEKFTEIRLDPADFIFDAGKVIPGYFTISDQRKESTIRELDAVEIENFKSLVNKYRKMTDNEFAKVFSE